MYSYCYQCPRYKLAFLIYDFFLTGTKNQIKVVQSYLARKQPARTEVFSNPPLLTGQHENK